MIRTITIHNIALIEDVCLKLYPGMQVLSGETGAGKSIIIDAVSLILGGRAARELIRSGCERASVEAEFDAEGGSGLREVLERENIPTEGDSLILYREISLTGRNVCRMNGVMVPAAVLKEAAAFLLNLHGQSEHQFLADPDRHLAYLDLMGDTAHRKLMDKTAEAYGAFITNHRAYAKLVKMNENREEKTETVRKALEELRRADIHPGEEAELAEESKRLIRSSRIHDRIVNAYQLLGNGETGIDALHNLQGASRELHKLGGEDPEFETLAGECENLYYNLEELVYRLSGLTQKYDFSPEALETVENRLESLRKLGRKYGPAEEDMLRSLDELEQEYETLTSLGDELEKTGNEHRRLLAQYRAAARELTESRKKLAETFEKRMTEELKDLGMEHTVIQVAFAGNPGGKPLMPSPAGDDRICFMMSPNPGEPLKPMDSIASGGELSRLMLAVKSIEAGRSGVQTMIFDEIDTGISGRMAQAVAEKMTAIARRQQVICISHLPQIAAAADRQVLIYKHVQNGRTVTEACELDQKRRVEEIARMISGAQGITDEARQYASRMLEAAAQKKASAG